MAEDYPKTKSAVIFVLKALIPYSPENMLLSFSPNRFFNELEKISKYKRKTLEQALRRAEQRRLIEKKQNVYRLTKQGMKNVRPFLAKKLQNNAKLMVIFDVPEEQSAARAKLRWALRKWEFEQAQKSVWITIYDHRQSVNELVNELSLTDYVELYECLRIKD